MLFYILGTKNDADQKIQQQVGSIQSQSLTPSGRCSLLTVSMSVFILGGSNKRVTDSTKTKKAMTIRNRPLMKPESISTRPYLQKTRVQF